MIIKFVIPDHYSEPLVRYIDDVVQADILPNRIEFSKSTSSLGETETIWVGGPNQPSYLALIDAGWCLHELGEWKEKRDAD